MEPWQVLGVSPHATPDEVDAAYKARARLLHPDLDRAATPAEQTRRNAAMAELNAARDAMRGRTGTVYRARPGARVDTGGGGGRHAAGPGRPATGGFRSPPQTGPDSAPRADGTSGDLWEPERREAPPSGPAATNGWAGAPSAGSEHGDDSDGPAGSEAPLWTPNRSGRSPVPAGRRGRRSGTKGFLIVATLGAGAAVLVVAAIGVLIAFANAFGDGSEQPSPAAPAAVAEIGPGDCIARGDSGFDGVLVDCAQPHLGKVTVVVSRSAVCPDTTEYQLTRDGDSQQYCIDGDL